MARTSRVTRLPPPGHLRRAGGGRSSEEGLPLLRHGQASARSGSFLQRGVGRQAFVEQLGTQRAAKGDALPLHLRHGQVASQLVTFTLSGHHFDCENQKHDCVNINTRRTRAQHDSLQPESLLPICSVPAPSGDSFPRRSTLGEVTASSSSAGLTSLLLRLTGDLGDATSHAVNLLGGVRLLFGGGAASHAAAFPAGVVSAEGTAKDLLCFLADFSVPSLAISASATVSSATEETAASSFSAVDLSCVEGTGLPSSLLTEAGPGVPSLEVGVWGTVAQDLRGVLTSRDCLII